MHAGKMIPYHRSFLVHQEKSLSASKTLHLPRRSSYRHAAAVMEVREAALTVEEAGAPAIQVYDKPNHRREEEEFHRFHGSLQRCRGRENRRCFLRHRRRVRHCARKAQRCFRILESCCRWKYDGYGGVVGSKERRRWQQRRRRLQ